MCDVTRILGKIEAGDPAAAKDLMPLVYDELRKLAAERMAQEKPGQTLQATALVHDAYIRLVDVDITHDPHAGTGHTLDQIVGQLTSRKVGHFVTRILLALDAAHLRVEVPAVVSEELFPGQLAKPRIERQRPVPQVGRQFPLGVDQRVRHHIRWIEPGGGAIVHVDGHHSLEPVTVSLQQNRDRRRVSATGTIQQLFSVGFA